MAEEKIKEKCLLPQVSFFCSLLLQIQINKKAFEDTSKSPLLRLHNYIYLRKQGMIKHQSQYLEELKKEIVEKKNKNHSFLQSYINQLLGHGDYEQAKSDLNLFYKEKLLEKDTFSQLKKHIDKVKKELSLK